MLFSKAIYDLGNWAYFTAIKIISPVNAKAKAWVNGRKNWKQAITTFSNQNNKPVIWLHAASLGEFEQGRPVIEQIKNENPSVAIVVSFFSPSGYQIQANYKHADLVCYLPINNKRNAKFFIETISPKLVLWVKYDYWGSFLYELKNKQIPTVLFSAKFRLSQPFFKCYGAYWRKMLSYFTTLIVQDEASKALLKSIHIESNVVSDTRFDRVLTIAQTPFSDSKIEAFVNQQKCVVAGSTWLEDEEEICHFANNNQHIKFIIAPHHIDKTRLEELKNLFKNSVLYSAYKTDELYNVLIIDNIGNLSYLYRYGTVCYIGGGFNQSGIHNTLEAAVYGKPIIFGPVYEKFKEANDLIETEAAISIESATEFEEALTDILEDDEYGKEMSNAAQKIVAQNTGGTQQILIIIKQNGFLPIL